MRLERKMEIFNKIIDIIIVVVLTITAGIVVNSEWARYVCIGSGSLVAFILCCDIPKINNKYKN